MTHLYRTVAVGVAWALIGVTLLPRGAAAVMARLEADAYTNASAPTSNEGKATNLEVVGPAGVKEAYIQFDLSTLPAGTTGADVTKATLTLFANTVSTVGSMNVVRVTSAWTETGITSGSAPTLGSTEQSAVPVTVKNTFTTVDVTAVVKAWADGSLANNGLALVPNVAGLKAYFDSKENTSRSHPAQLDVTLTDVHEPAANIFIGDGVGAANTGNANTAVGAVALQDNTSGGFNTAVGEGALDVNTAGNNNTAVGANALEANTTGTDNSALGQAALHANTTGGSNTAVGQDALQSNTTGANNTAVGLGALLSNTAGGLNTAVGQDALSFNTTGTSNTALGVLALNNNTSAGDNTAVGFEALFLNTIGTDNTAVGETALAQNTTGADNTAVGTNALGANTTANFNTAVGRNALAVNVTGTENAAFGDNALQAATSQNHTTAVGDAALFNLTAGDDNTAVGHFAGINLTSGSNNLYVDNAGAGSESNTIRIGDTQLKTFIAGIDGATSSGGVAVFVNASGQLGTTLSSRRYKNDIRDMGDASSGLLKLRPVSFRYKKDLDPSGLKQYGLVAEEVAKLYPDLVVFDDKGRPETVRYQFLAPMLLNELQKQARENKTQQQQIEALTARVQQASAQAQQIEALTARLVQLEATVGVQGSAPAVQASYKMGAGL